MYINWLQPNVELPDITGGVGKSIETVLRTSSVPFALTATQPEVPLPVAVNILLLPVDVPGVRLLLHVQVWLVGTLLAVKVEDDPQERFPGPVMVGKDVVN